VRASGAGCGTTVADPAATRAPDRVKRQFVAGSPDRLWVADFMYCRTRAGWAYTAFVTDVYARKIVGWKVATEMTQSLLPMRSIMPSTPESVLVQPL
jgi:putative transposase